MDESRESLVEQSATVLELAAELLETHGWCQGKMYDGNRSCVVGAITRVEREQNMGKKLAFCARRVDPGYMFYSFLVTEGVIDPGQSFSIPEWNDVPDRRIEDVLSALRKAALTARENVAF